MGEPEARMAKLRSRIEVRWNDARTARVQRRVMQSQRRQLVGRAGGAFAVAMLCVLGGPFLLRLLLPRLPAAPVAGPAEEVGRPLWLMDHSLASPLTASDVLVVKEDGPQRTIVEVVRGSARFDVVRRPERLFRVEAGPVKVDVLGTVFRVERGHAQVTVAVERGQVRVLWGGYLRVLAAGQKESFPPDSEHRSMEARQALREHEADSSVPVTAPAWSPGQASATAEAAAVAGDPLASPAPPQACRQSAPQAASAARPADVASETGGLRARTRHAVGLLQAADEARRGRNPAAALKLLEESLRDHPADPRAPLAAFTLGKVELEELGQPEEAARAFALAQELAPEGPLAEDALAREVRAWDAAGQESRARERAEEYLRRYPQGTWAVAVRRYGQRR